MESFKEYLAARWFQKQAGRLVKLLPGIRKAEDIECVHRARVACRRLRAAMELFVDWPSPKQQSRWEKQIRRAGRSLGAARDLDVQLLFLCERWAEMSRWPLRVGLAHLVVRWEAQREAQQKKVVRAVDRLEESGVLPEIQQTVRRWLGKDQCSEAELGPKVLWKEAVVHLQGYAEALGNFSPYLEEPEAQSQHHAMRIAGKHLRYTLEMLAPVLGPESQSMIEALQTFQTLLGEVHDCDVWQEQLADLRARGLGEDFMRWGGKWTKKQARRIWGRVEAAIEFLQQDRLQARQRLFQQAREHWQKVLQAEVGEGLELLVRRGSLRSERKERMAREGCVSAEGQAGPSWAGGSRRPDTPHLYKMIR